MRFQGLPGAICAVVLSASACSSCQIEELMPGTVAMGAARLTVLNTAVLTALITADSRCGFSSQAVNAKPFIQGQPGQRGAVTLTVESCTLDFGTLHEVQRGCTNVTTSAGGTATISATRRIVGTLTGDSKTPIIPDGADAVHIHVDARLDQLQITRSSTPGSLQYLAGGLHWDAQPYLALSHSLGVCAIPTTDVAISNIVYEDATMVFSGEGHVFNLTVPTSNFNALIGRWGGHQNTLAGAITVWNHPVDLPDGDYAGVDPNYNPERYQAMVACVDDLVQPVRYDCPSVKDQLVQGAAKLTIVHLGTLAGLAAADTRCGFASQGVLESARLTGNAGSPGKATLRVTHPCTLSYPTPTELAKDCNGSGRIVSGSATFTGTQTLTGVLTGSTAQPVAPSSRDPIQFDLSVTLSDFAITDSTGGPSMKVVSGTLRGTVRPRLGIDPETAICSKPTPIAEFTHVEWQDARLQVSLGAITLEASVSSASLEAQAGEKDGRTNYLSGIMVSDGVPTAIPPPGTLPILDPTYDPVKLASALNCGSFQMPANDEDCSFNRVLAVNAARLSVQNVGALAQLVNANSQCGFENLSVLLHPTRVEGSSGQEGLLAWKVSECVVGSAGVTQTDTDCDGAARMRSGSAAVSAERIVTGERNTQYVIAKSVIPRSPDAVTLTLTGTRMNELSAFTIPAGKLDPIAKLVVHSGSMSAKVSPILAERLSTPNVYDVPTPVAVFDLTLTDLVGTLHVGAMAFSVDIPSATLSAQNGSFRGVSNTLSGTVVIGGANGETVVLAPSPLNPDFTQAGFDHAYACTPDMKSTVPPN